MIEYSYKDKQREIKIPSSLTSDLAELIGIIVGDGHITLKHNKKYEIVIVGHITEDEDYHLSRVCYLFRSLFNLQYIPQIFRKDMALRGIDVSSKAIVTFLVEEMGLSYGNKMQAEKLVPRIILNSPPETKAAFIRGVADTDFTLRFKRRKTVKNPFHYDPFIDGHFGNKQFAYDVLNIICSLGIHAYFLITRKEKDGKKFIGYHISSSGKRNLQKWMETICFNNYKHTTKYDIWDTYGFCPPYTTLKEREEILSGDAGLLKKYIMKMEQKPQILPSPLHTFAAP